MALDIHNRLQKAHLFSLVFSHIYFSANTAIYNVKLSTKLIDNTFYLA